ncbi:hypothetical protein KAJ83_11600 [Marivibrio halodurans]|uniref:Phospholipase/carboxylesterase/thioesterase domain-containing protein n=1 Tax=Marivibrio halodurans TaxID=2039722 RepID=A0A8J7V2S8_9PROT|nr:hypothetical protein [Marivibrio halodurans]MBP5857655.1 hypothetical protein [Marivibrio halodurans]
MIARWIAACGIAVLTMVIPPAHACGPDSDCRLDNGRTYRIAMPNATGAEGGDRGPVGAILYVHGYKGTAAGSMGNSGLRALARSLGIALIAANSDGGDWPLPNSPSVLRGETTADLDGAYDYFEAVLADAADRFGIDRDRVMISGFSAGAMMVWWLACERSNLAVGFAPVSGTFWTPVPEDCPAEPAHLFHTHGSADPVVPLGGRRIGPAKQGVVRQAVTMYRAAGGYRFTRRFEQGDLRCERWRNPRRKLLDLCLHDDGHRLDPEHLRRAWTVLEKTGAFSPER